MTMDLPPPGMMEAIERIYNANAGNRDNYEKAARHLTESHLPGAPQDTKDAFVKMCLQVYDRMQS